MSTRVRCKSGIEGWQNRLQANYANFEEFERYCEYFNIHGRLGFPTPKAAWNKNPLTRGSVVPGDLKTVKPRNHATQKRPIRNHPARRAGS